MAHAFRYLIAPLSAGWMFAASIVGAAEPALPPLRFTVFSARPIENLVHTPGPDVLPSPMIFYPTARSPEYEHPGDAPLRFCDQISGTLVAEAIVPPAIRQALLLFVPEAGESGAKEHGYRIQILDDSRLRHGPGGVSIINLSGMRLSGTVGNRTVMVNEGLGSPMRISDMAGIELYATVNGRRYRSYADVISLAAGERALLILFPPFYPGSLEVQGRLLVDAPAEPMDAQKASAAETPAR